MPKNRFFDNQKIIIQRGKCECDWLLTCCECIIHPPIIISVHAHSWQPVVISCRANLSLVSLLSPANQSTNQDQFSLALPQIHHQIVGQSPRSWPVFMWSQIASINREIIKTGRNSKAVYSKNLSQKLQLFSFFSFLLYVSGQKAEKTHRTKQKSSKQQTHVGEEQQRRHSLQSNALQAVSKQP